ncbi:MAG: hypothetical protein HQ588_06315 [Deltaproteobacteria bacterium]|nr:hypothetical protein [Deltaproteobacteria bacterium]
MIVMIKSVIRCPNDMVLVFDDDEEQIPEYEGWYQQVRELILQDAPPDTVFGYWFNYEADISTLPREEW